MTLGGEHPIKSNRLLEDTENLMNCSFRLQTLNSWSERGRKQVRRWGNPLRVFTPAVAHWHTTVIAGTRTTVCAGV
jgi:hypothetical protein